MPNNAQYQYACLKGEHPKSVWGFIKTRAITQLIVDEDRRTRLTDHLTRLAASNDTASSIHPVPSDSVILIKGDGNCSARAMLFGVLISASIAIKNHAPDAIVMQEAVYLLYNHAVELRKLYKKQCSELIKQSQEFPLAGNSLIAIIQAVYFNQISTTELVYQANKDCLPGVTSSLNLALTDLSHYVLWKAAQKFLVETNPLLMDELAKIRLIRGYEDKKNRRMSDLLKTGIPYTPLPLSLLSSYLSISTQTLTIANNLTVSMMNTGLANHPVAFTMVTAFGNTNLLLDVNIRKQIIQEYPQRRGLKFDDIETRYMLPGFQYTPIVLREDELTNAKDHCMELYDEAIRVIHEITFPLKLVDICDLFFNKIRQLTWVSEQRDPLFELEEVLSKWYAHLVNSPDLNHPVIQDNKILIRSVLNDIYRGERGTLSALFRESRDLQLAFYLGGIDDKHVGVAVDLGIFCLHPKDYQAVLVLMAGINRTSIQVSQVDYPARLNTMVDYVMQLMEFSFIAPLKRETIKAAVLQVFKNELSSMPQHVIHPGDPGFEDYLNELNNVNHASRRFNAVCHDMFQVGFVDGSDDLHLGAIDNSSSEALRPAICSRDPESLLNAQAAGRRDLKCQQPLDKLPLRHDQTELRLPWPKNTHEFEQSISNTVQCRAQWIQRLQECDVSEITEYFKQLSEKIRYLPHERDAERFIQNIELFAKTLQKIQPTLFGINIMLNTAKHTLSPTVTRRRHCYVVRMDDVQRLPGDLEKIRTRTSPVVMLTKNPLDKKPVREHEQGIQIEPSSYLHTRKPISHPIAPLVSTPEKDIDFLIQSIQSMVDIKNGSTAQFDSFFFVFNTRLLTMLAKYPDEKAFILTCIIDGLCSRVTREELPNIMRVISYLQRLSKRVQAPIINADVAREFEDLVNRYERRSATEWDTKKHTFLINLRLELKNHPEKTYAECVRTVRYHPDHDFKPLFSISRQLKHCFFNSSVTNVVNRLEALDFSDQIMPAYPVTVQKH